MVEKFKYLKCKKVLIAPSSEALNYATAAKELLEEHGSGKEEIKSN